MSDADFGHHQGGAGASANPEQQAARHRELARLWLAQLASLIQGRFKQTRQRLEPKGAAIYMVDEDGHELLLRTCAHGTQWQAFIVGGRDRARLQTGGKLIATSSAVLEDAQALVVERLIKPLR